MKLSARKCAVCGKTMGVFAFARGYYHPACLRKAKHTIKMGKDKRLPKPGA